MPVGLSIKPGRSGTRKLVEQDGERLIWVHYRYDEEKKKRDKTVELIIEETSWTPKKKPPANEIISIRVEVKEKELQSRIKREGGRWNPHERVWKMRDDAAVKPGLKPRIISTESISL
jgi:hypothetical protein